MARRLLYRRAMMTNRTVLAILFCAGVLAGCGGNNETEPTPDSGPSVDGRAGPDVAPLADLAPTWDLAADHPAAEDVAVDMATLPDTATVLDTSAAADSGVDGAGAVILDGGDTVDGGGPLVPADFTRLVLRAGSGDRSPVDPASTCDGSYVGTYVVDGPSSTLSWSYCATTSPTSVVLGVIKGQLKLSPVQLLGLRMAAASIHASADAPSCTAAGYYLTLDVEAGAGTGLFIDQLLACTVGSEPRIVVDHVYELMQEIGKLETRPGDPGVFIAPEGFVRLTLRSTGGMPPLTDPTSTCNVSYLNTYAVDAAAASLACDTCSPVAAGSSKRAPNKSTRTLARDELDRVSVALAKIKLSTQTGCGLDKPTVTLDVQTAAGSASYADDFYACRNSYGKPVSNIDDLAYLLPGLCSIQP
jgi:hypothetical protein